MKTITCQSVAFTKSTPNHFYRCLKSVAMVTRIWFCLLYLAQSLCVPSYISVCLCMAVCTSVSTVSTPPSLPLFSLPVYRLHLCVFVSLCICLYLCHCIFVSLYFCRSVSVRLFCYSVSLSLFLVLFSFRCMLLMPTRHIPSFSTFHIVSLPPPLTLCFSYAVFLCRRL